MDALRMIGGHRLQGRVRVSGSKNAALPIMTAAILAAGESVLHNVPDLADIHTLVHVLSGMGIVIQQDPERSTLHLNASNITHFEAPYDLVRTMRAAILVLGPLLARCGMAKVSLPGGCAIGMRPIDQHLKGLKILGAKIHIENGYVIAEAPHGLTGAEIAFDISTVTGTENLLLAAAAATGTTVLTNAAVEPEVADLICVLQSMGCHIEGINTTRLVIHGSNHLQPYNHTVIADRIECGTFLVAGAMMAEELHIYNAIAEHQTALLEKLRLIGAHIELHDAYIAVQRAAKPQAINIQTAVYPGMPTDMQAQMMALLATAKGTSTIVENIFENRFMHVAELDRLGADIRVDGRSAVIHGVQKLSASTVMATDLRASACLVLAGLVAEGETTIRRIYHLDRGYDHIEKKLSGVGAHIERFKET